MDAFYLPARRQAPGPANANAVAARAWLVAHQLADGSWDGPNALVATGVSLLALLAEPAASNESIRAAQYLVSHQDEAGSWAPIGTEHAAWSQGVATWALAQFQVRHPSAPTLEAITRSANAIMRAQQARGGWSDTMGPVSSASAFASVLQVMALRSAALAGIRSGALDRCAERAADYFAAGGSDNRNDCAERALGLQLLGQGMSDAALDGLAAASDESRTWPARVEMPRLEIYFLHLAALQHERWMDRAWLASLRPAIAESQHADGSWGVKPQAASDPSTTAICAMILSDIQPASPAIPAPSAPCVEIAGSSGHALVLWSIPLRRSDPLRLDFSVVQSISNCTGIVTWSPGDFLVEKLADAMPRDTLMDVGPAAAHAFAELQLSGNTLYDFVLFRPPARPLRALFSEEEAFTLSSPALARALPALPRTEKAWTTHWLEMRRAWKAGDAELLQAAVDGLTRGAEADIEAARRSTAERIASLLSSPGNYLIVLDAWLGPVGMEQALRESGLLAQRLGERAQPAVQ